MSGELSGDGTRAAFISARSAGPASEDKDGKAAQRWDERVELSVTNPKTGGESASEIGLDLTITNLSEAFLTDLQTATQETAVNPDAAFRVLGIWSRAFMKDGIALNLTDARYVRGKDAAHLKGLLLTRRRIRMRRVRSSLEEQAGALLNWLFRKL